MLYLYLLLRKCAIAENNENIRNGTKLFKKGVNISI